MKKYLPSGPKASTQPSDSYKRNSSEEMSNNYESIQGNPSGNFFSKFSSHGVLAIILLLISVIIVLPTIAIHLVKSPSPSEDVLVMGVSYFNLFLIYQLSTIILLVYAVFYLRAKASVLAVSLAIFLFCAVPLAIALRQGLTIEQAMQSISFLSSWPFFLKPLYVLTVVLLPAGALIYLFLQLRALFSREESYAFLGAAIILILASYLGSYELTRDGQPTLLSLIYSQQQESQVASVDRESLPEDASVSSSADISTTQDTLTAPTANAPVKSVTAQPNIDQALEITQEIGHTSSDFTSDSSVKATSPIVSNNIGEQFNYLNTKLNNLATSQAKVANKHQAALDAINQRVADLIKKLDLVIDAMENSHNPPQDHTPPSSVQNDRSEEPDYETNNDATRY